MTPKQWCLLIGGVIPAVGLGIAAVFQKLASQQGIGTGPFLIVTGLTTCVAGCLFLLFDHQRHVNVPAIGLTCLFALCWACATGCITLALRQLGGTIGQLAPLYNMNTLIAVLMGLVLLSEWKTIDPVRILAATALILIGGILAARS